MLSAKRGLNGFAKGRVRARSPVVPPTLFIGFHPERAVAREAQSRPEQATEKIENWGARELKSAGPSKTKRLFGTTKVVP